MSDTAYVGKRLPRYDGMQHATGKTRFVGDIKLPNMLHVQAWPAPITSSSRTSARPPRSTRRSRRRAASP